MSLIDFCNRDVVTVRPEASAQAAAQLLRDRCVGALVVVADGTRPIGIVTDRDLALRVIATEHDPERTRVADVMSHPVITAGALDRIEVTTARMRELGIRRMPVVSPDGQLIGILTIDDLVELVGRELHDLGEAVRKEVMACRQRS